mgnify:CR=1 FL=1
MRGFLWLCFGLCATLLGAEGPQRIASYSPGATQTLLDLGCRERIVAATRWCPLPPSHTAARTCDAFNPDLETLRLAKPDLVVLPRLANPLWAERCTRAGLKVVVLNTENPESVRQDLELLGQATGQTAASQTLQARLADRVAARDKTLLVIWDGMMAGPEAYTTLALKQAGFKSPLPAGTWIKLDWETIVKANPDAVLWLDSTPTNGPIAPSQKHQKEMSEVIVVKELKCVKDARVFGGSSGSDWLPGTGVIQAAAKLREIRQTLD